MEDLKSHENLKTTTGELTETKLSFFLTEEVSSTNKHINIGIVCNNTQLQFQEFQKQCSDNYQRIIMHN